jgi:hypothetical protein
MTLGLLEERKYAPYSFFAYRGSLKWSEKEEEGTLAREREIRCSKFYILLDNFRVLEDGSIQSLQ